MISLTGCIETNVTDEEAQNYQFVLRQVTIYTMLQGTVGDYYIINKT